MVIWEIITNYLVPLECRDALRQCRGADLLFKSSARAGIFRSHSIEEVEWTAKGGAMSGARLCAVLAELGFGGHESLDPDSFEWPFQHDDVRPLLDWICSSLRPSNVLSPSELSQYKFNLRFFSFAFVFFVCMSREEGFY